MRSLRYIMGAAARRRSGGGGGGSMSVTQTGSVFEGWMGSGTPTATFGGAVGSGSDVLVMVRANTADTFTVTCGDRSTSTPDFVSAESNSQTTRYYRLANVTSAPTTVTTSNASSLGLLCAFEVPSCVYVTGAGGTAGASGTSHSQAFTTSGTNQLMIGESQVTVGIEATHTATAPAVTVRGGAVYGEFYRGVYPSAGANSLQITTDGTRTIAISVAVYGAA